MNSNGKGITASPALISLKGCEDITSQSKEACKQHAFDSFCKKILKGTARNYYHKLKKQAERQILFSELPEHEIAKLSATDSYFVDASSFSVQGIDVAVLDTQLAAALKTLSTDLRNIIILSFYLGMNDREIAEQLQLVRRTVAYRRARTLESLRKAMEESKDE